MAMDFKAAVDPVQLDALAGRLGLSAAALQRFGVGWSAVHRAWTFPMIDPSGKVLGIRLRSPLGDKYAVKGSKQGLFIPDGCSGNQLLITEGPTDAAALLDMGFSFVVGRPSCAGAVKLLIDLVRRHPADVVIVADGDEPGRRGADDLAGVLVAYVSTVRIITPPDGIKDGRQWLQAGGTKADVEAALQTATARNLAFRSRDQQR